MPLYLKTHSYGEYVFDWAWADAYHRHGLHYYPKLLAAVPFTPVTGARLLADIDEQRDRADPRGARARARSGGLLAALPVPAARARRESMRSRGMMLRHAVQFHWSNAGYESFDHFLAGMSHDKRKKVKQERRRVHEAGIAFAGWRARRSRDARLALCHALLPADLPRPRLHALSQPGILPAHRPRHAAASAAGRSPSATASDRRLAQRAQRQAPVRPLLGRAGVSSGTALRDLLLPGDRLLHRARHRSSRAARAASTSSHAA